ncbi:ADP-ribose pyrophosphatase [hydrothermal vent metagenome]|uniref:ADP-ribose pyrophosphatase n=1 Tax=hydrothermal vent metagenome TaxID=652676 RepID=A0A3B1BF51_9ZZZZ
MKKGTVCPGCGETVEEWVNPRPTVDIIIEVDKKIVLIERVNEPFGWALPGGYVDYGESLEAAAVREAKEETGLYVTLIRQFHAYSEPSRDPRSHNISVVFIASADGHPAGGDDAMHAALFSKDNLPGLVFDHEKIVDDYFNARY